MLHEGATLRKCPATKSNRPMFEAIMKLSTLVLVFLTICITQAIVQRDGKRTRRWKLNFILSDLTDFSPLFKQWTKVFLQLPGTADPGIPSLLYLCFLLAVKEEKSAISRWNMITSDRERLLMTVTEVSTSYAEGIIIVKVRRCLHEKTCT